ncbi:MAG: envelope biogenesis factor ElyC [Deltaproteobacteria bacterium]|nr:envelope biogenesis factor ElyC [Deltaproteobacteria bacterium]
MFLLKKVVSAFLMPLPLCLLLALSGFALLRFGKRPRLGKLLLSGALLLLLAFSLAPVSDRLLGPLESRYPVFDAGALPPGSPEIGFVVVLGEGYGCYENQPPTSRVHRGGLVRLAEGIRIQRLLPGAKLIVSGGFSGKNSFSNARVLADLAVALGVPEADILLEGKSLDTEGEARLIRPLVGDTPFVLVTAASHLPRAMGLFAKQGMAPIPAPTDHLVKKRPFSLWTLVPTARELHKTEMAFHEYLGIAWGQLRSRI